MTVFVGLPHHVIFMILYLVDMFRITSVVKVETHIMAFGLAVILVIMYDQTFKTDFNVSIANVIMCFTSH